MTENTDLSKPHQHTVTINGTVYQTDESGVHRHAYGTPTPPPSTVAVGLYVDGESPAGIAALATALGVTCTWENVSCWDSSAGEKAVLLTALPWPLASPPAPPYTVMLAIGQASAAQATAVAQTLAANGCTGALVRVMWEMNGDWFPWGASKLSATEYVAAYRTVVAAMRAVSPAFRFCWNPVAGTTGMWAVAGRTWDDTYPGDDVVDVVGVDCYDYGSDMPGIIAPVAPFAAAHGKPVALCEWGLLHADGTATDDPAYITAMAAWAVSPATRCLLQVYFNSAVCDLRKFPLSAAAYRSAFS